MPPWVSFSGLWGNRANLDTTKAAPGWSYRNSPSCDSAEGR
jgi:hypothetical protein